jgi:branched-chain amino acid aminotransferase
MVVWFNGAMIEGQVAIDPADRGLLLGDGLFETVAVQNGKPMWLAEHLARLRAGADELGIDFPQDAVERGLAAVLGNVAFDYGVLRISLTRGPGGRSLAASDGPASLLLTLKALDAGMKFSPCSLMMVDVVRHSKAPSTRLKTLSYIDNIMAARQAAALGYDEGLMLNEQGYAACATIGNIFLVRGHELLTPSLDQAILPGIMRSQILQLAPGLGFSVREGHIDKAELAAADGMFISNSLRWLRPVKHFGSRLLQQPYEPIIVALRAMEKV